LAVVKLDRLYGYVHKTGTVVIPITFPRRFGESSEGRDYVELNHSSLGYSDTQGQLIFRADKVDVGDPFDFQEGLVKVQPDEGAIRSFNRSGKVALEVPHEFGRHFNESLAPVRTKDDDWAS
jgi:hypothetical protein